MVQDVSFVATVGYNSYAPSDKDSSMIANHDLNESSVDKSGMELLATKDTKNTRNKSAMDDAITSHSEQHATHGSKIKETESMDTSVH